MPSVESVAGVLTGLAADRATGSLRLGRAGVLYLTGGRVTYAQSAAAPRLEDLLVAGLGIPAGVLRQLRRATGEEPREGDGSGGGEHTGEPVVPGEIGESGKAGNGERQPRGPLPSGGERLVATGLLTRGELEFCVLSAVFDAAYFLLGAATGRPRFRPGERHWLGPQWHVEVAVLLRECERRKEQLERTWPSAELDTLPVVPLRRIGAQRVVLSPLQWEVLVGADSSATPAELARRLGRPAYSVLLAVRQLASSGLLQVPVSSPALPAPAPSPPPAPALSVPEAPLAPSAPSAPSAPAPAEAPVAPAEPTAPSVPAAPAVPAEPAASGASAGPAARDPLPRRARGATEIPAPAGSVRTAEWLPTANGDPADVNLLIRLRNALEALT